MTYTEEFDEVWKEYPNKKGKKRSFEYYKKLRKDYSMDKIKRATMIFAKEMQGREKRYIKHGSGFFNNNLGLIYDYFDLIDECENNIVKQKIERVVF